MIHHISIAANDPLHVAQVLAEMFAGQAIPFPEHPGSYIALPLDLHGTMIEVHPRGTELMPGSGMEACQARQNSNPSPYTATHAAISVSTSEDHIRAIAEREGWHIAQFSRQDFFDVIEVWVENQLLLEFLPPALAAKYLDFMQSTQLKQILAAV
ncbi:hypothetical protein IQ268_15630 [Oculatella sp. LEGE 06141]|uniref:hypothetical protein n=1 Tax=Oculatella sp. LEGE 06141 TaxID=1828648 RepID=UPI00188063D0|nr:hypothetical protein [Oculatella sp. LEGE 06141]MBE9180000.1 hypothetical protein [Oculatella sp. LEGE 06141]